MDYSVIPLVFGLFFVTFIIFWIFTLVKILRQRRVLKYTDPLRDMEITGRVRQLKVRGNEEEAVQLVQNELAMPVGKARAWVKSI
ncbi:hypothetical protein AB0G15_36155 [Streptosporangium sp. NPDC023825]|uniref:hypothetical protein n=1 Tax=Streptosporangium sp. NPDC023825 TaxID=3154909 RepID=UPI00342F1B18